MSQKQQINSLQNCEDPSIIFVTELSNTDSSLQKRKEQAKQTLYLKRV